VTPEELFESHYHIAKETIFKMFNNPKGVCNQHRIQMDDLLQIARLGLWQASLKYSPDKGTKFMSFAISNIRWTVMETLNRKLSIIKYNCNNMPDQKYGIISIDAEHSEDSDGNNTYHDIISSDVNVQENAFGNIGGDNILSRLGDKQKEIIKLKVKGLSSGDIGRMWGMTAANVRHHANKAKKQLEEYQLEVV
jgi:RNA polymerase sigma factor (sigma-70 family)